MTGSLSILTTNLLPPFCETIANNITITINNITSIITRILQYILFIFAYLIEFLLNIPMQLAIIFKNDNIIIRKAQVYNYVVKSSN